uniref:C2 domain-containing protein n=1 Tax=Lotharella oceanica TaxID=641309 RepID=A0A7S2TWZ6_9EUKA|mmetsp:Transcript_32089/g.59740  ORF Transcript_32089/g.59740 Transcript_32089/m.59740 type:complete len:101 (+) Transcript_32089:219-521(+)
MLCWTGAPEDTLELECWDEDWLSKDDSMGMYRVDFEGLPEGKAQSLVIPLREKCEEPFKWQDLLVEVVYPARRISAFAVDNAKMENKKNKRKKKGDFLGN